MSVDGSDFEGATEAFYAGRKSAQETAEREKRLLDNAGRTGWPQYGTTIAEHEHASHIQKFIEERRKEKGKIFIMDAMGPGGLFPEGAVDGELALTLVEPRADSQKPNDEVQNKEVVSGDILSGKTWKKVDDYIEKHKGLMNDGFDFIFCRPVAGWITLTGESHTPNAGNQVAQTHAIEYLVTNNLFQRLSPSGGMLMIELQEKISNDWMNVLNSTPGVVAKRDGNRGLVIDRNDSAALKLPRP